jgi:hypothetical protein
LAAKTHYTWPFWSKSYWWIDLCQKLDRIVGLFYLEEKIYCLHQGDGGSNLNTMTIALKSIIHCDMVGLEENFQGICFDHAFLKQSNM